ncbi:MAG: methylated-DNA--[protein]-cysteine S-methyltransferase [Spirochaetales bacterium]|nr:methylated-DNA--[protein]-cysteine S-methyltransferase [Candidatus Physcosoma equi]
MIHSVSFETKIGPVTVREEDGAIVSVLFRFREEDTDPTPLLQEAKKEILEYFSGSRKTFDLPLAPKGTMFQKSVWKAIYAIPYGETRSYGDLAKCIGSKGFQAVGSACGKNPIPIIIPCHRVISSDGTIGGFSGPFDIKVTLLEDEGAHYRR